MASLTLVRHVGTRRERRLLASLALPVLVLSLLLTASGYAALGLGILLAAWRTVT